MARASGRTTTVSSRICRSRPPSWRNSPPVDGHDEETLAAVLVTLNLLAFAFHTAARLAVLAWRAAVIARRDLSVLRAPANRHSLRRVRDLGPFAPIDRSPPPCGRLDRKFVQARDLTHRGQSNSYPEKYRTRCIWNRWRLAS